MSNQFATNFTIGSSSDPINVLWKLTRVMKAAGWQYRASGLQSYKDTSGIAANDLWGSNANPLLDTYAPFGTGGPIVGAWNQATTTLPQATITYTPTSGTQFNAGGGTVSILSSAGWQTVTYGSASATTLSTCSGGTGTVVAGGANGGSTMVQGTGNIGLDGLGGAAGGPWWCASGPLTVKVPLSALPTGTPLRSELVTQATSGATGELFGFVWDPVGLTGWAVIGPQHTPANTTIASTSSAQVLPQSTINVASTSGFASSGIANIWTAQTVTTVATPSGGASLPVATLTVTSGAALPAGPGFVWVLTTAGSSTVYQQVYYTSITTNTLNGTSGGTGTIVANGTANSVLAPGSPSQISYTGTSGGNQLTGCTGGTGVMMTGNAVTGYSAVFDNTHTITGGTSGATMTPTGTVTYFQREVMFGKPAASNTTGNIYYVCADGYLENNQFLSTLAGTVGCTATVGPGESGTNNTLNNSSPVTGNPLQLCITGTGGSLTAGASAFLFGTAAGTTYGASAQIGCANAIPASTVTADGSFYAALSTTTAGTMSGLVFSRLDDQEPGDCDPYAWLVPTSTTNTLAAFTRATNAVTAGQTFTGTTLFAAGGFVNWIGYQARGCTLTTHDVPYGYVSSGNWCFNTTAALTQGFLSNNPIRLVAHPSSGPPIVREPILLFTSGATANTFKQIKGRARWVVFFSIGNTLDTFDSKTWFATSVWSASNPVIAIGPYDGSSTPIP